MATEYLFCLEKCLCSCVFSFSFVFLVVILLPGGGGEGGGRIFVSFDHECAVRGVVGAMSWFYVHSSLVLVALVFSFFFCVEERAKSRSDVCVVDVEEAKWSLPLEPGEGERRRLSGFFFFFYSLTIAVDARE